MTATLAEGDLEILGLLPSSSNYTFLARLGGSDGDLVVYKPRRGETPLWDFPDGTLCGREVAAFLVSEAGGWDLVPATVLRDGPLGPGAVQQFVEHDATRHAFNLADEYPDELRMIASFDLVVNNADRKAGHVLLGPGGRLWCIDHGLCFHVEPKLRTVLWDFIDEPLPKAALQALDRLCERLSGDLTGRLEGLLLPAEIDRLRARAEQVAANRVFPSPGPGRQFPWPPV